MMACTHAEDGEGDRKLAMHHFRIAIKLDPETPFYHVDGGKLPRPNTVIWPWA